MGALDCAVVALRKESVDRNGWYFVAYSRLFTSLSARRAWIEIKRSYVQVRQALVALRKESVDRNFAVGKTCAVNNGSLSARRAWIEMANAYMETVTGFCRSPQGERG